MNQSIKLNTLAITLLYVFVSGCKTTAQTSLTLEIEPHTVADAPAVQSFATGLTSDGKWLIIGGRTDGLHKRRPFEAFLQRDNNTHAFIIDPVQKKSWQASLEVLPSALFEQLQATNQQYVQRENTLYIIGGYGYSATKGDHTTYANLTAITVDQLAHAIINNKDITPFFRQLTHEKLAVTGGGLGLLNTTFYLCGGQYFEGRYNPMGPDHGPGFTQEYTNEIRTFKIEDTGTTLAITNYQALNDKDHLHRRDYNLVPQFFADGEKGFTMFSGVFRYDSNTPWLNTVDVVNNSYQVNNDFKQLLSQYHSAKVPLYNEDTGEMMTVFFGGLSQFQYNEQGALVEDINVPFVKTISMVTRSKDGSMNETELPIKLPAFLGAGATFIPVTTKKLYIDHEIVDLKKLNRDKTLIGYLYGGIESTGANVFFSNSAKTSGATNTIFKVYLTKH